MSIIRVNKRKGFFIAPNQPFNDKNLSWEARGVMGYLLSKPDGWECQNYNLVNQTDAGEYVINRILKELKEFGYLYRYRKSDGRGKIKWISEVYEMPSANPHFTKGQSFDHRKSRPSKESTDEKPHDIVNTDSNKDLPQEKTESISPSGEKSPSLSQDDFADRTTPSPVVATKPQHNGKPLSESEAAHLQTFGVLPGDILPEYDIIQEIQAAHWDKLTTNELRAIALYVMAVRTKRPDFAIPNDPGVRNDWKKSVGGHLMDYRIDGLGSLYQATIDKLDKARMPFSRPGSLTKTLPDIANQPATTQKEFDLSDYKVVPPTPIANPVKSTLTPQQIDKQFAKVREEMKNATD